MLKDPPRLRLHMVGGESVQFDPQQVDKCFFSTNTTVELNLNAVQQYDDSEDEQFQH